MSKRSKNAKAAQRKARKRSAKEARKALYASYAQQGRKANNSGDAIGGPTKDRGNHVMKDCGNPGCKRCYPQFNRNYPSKHPAPPRKT